MADADAYPHFNSHVLILSFLTLAVDHWPLQMADADTDDAFTPLGLTHPPYFDLDHWPRQIADAGADADADDAFTPLGHTHPPFFDLGRWPRQMARKLSLATGQVPNPFLRSENFDAS